MRRVAVVVRRWRGLQPFTRRLAVIAAIGFALRMAWVAATARIGIVSGSDQGSYVEAARNLADGEGFRSLYWSPAYALFLAPIVAFADLAEIPVRAVAGAAHAALATTSVVFVGLVGCRRVSATAGLAAAAVLAVWPNQVLAAGTVLSERLSTPLAVAGLACLLWSRARTRNVLYWAGGFTLALAALARPALVLLLPAAVAVVLLMDAAWRPRGGAAWRVLAGAALVVVPWLGYTYWITGEPLVFTTSSGFNLCLGNNDDATGGWSLEATEDECPWPAPPLVEEARADARLRSAALRWMVNNPDRQPELIVDRLELMLSYDSDATGWFPDYRSWDAPVPLQGFRDWTWRWWQLSVLLSVFGVAAVGHRLRAQLLVAAAAVVIVPAVSVAEGRYKDPLVPLMSLAIGVAVAKALTLRSRRPVRRDEVALPLEGERELAAESVRRRATARVRRPSPRARRAPLTSSKAPRASQLDSPR